MNPKAILGLVRSRLAYAKDWAVDELAPDEGDAVAERVFDLSTAFTEGREVAIDFPTIGRHLPFSIFAVVATGLGVIIISGGEEGLYAYCYTALWPMLAVWFTADGWRYEAWAREKAKGTVRKAEPEDAKAKEFVDAVATILGIIERECDNTRNIVSYTLNRAERRAVAREVGADHLTATVVHRICLTGKEKDRVTQQRGDTVVPTPKRLHEVRSHWRHLQSGSVVRVRSHRRGSRGDLLPRVYQIEAFASLRKGE